MCFKLGMMHRIMNKRFFAALGALCLLCSCTKIVQNPYSTSMWNGEYPVQTLNGTTGELEDHTGIICLYFRKDGEECIVETGIADMYATNRTTYQARWSNELNFTLYESSGDQSVDCYSGAIGGGKLTLKALNCDGVAATYELYRLLPE